MGQTSLVSLLALFAVCLAGPAGKFVGVVDVVPNDGSIADKLLVGYTLNQGLPNDLFGGYGYWGDVMTFPYIDRNKFAKARLYPVPDSINEKLGNGDQALLFSGLDPAVCDVLMKQFREAGVHAVSVERFLTVAGFGDEGGRAYRNLPMANVNASAVKYGRLFYAGYDLSGCEGSSVWVQKFKDDFTNNILRYTTAERYARHRGKPVVQLYVGGREISSADGINVVNWLKNQNMAVILIGHQNFRDSTYHWDLFASADIYQTWCSGDGSSDTLTNVYNNALGDVKWCQARGLDYIFLLCSGDGLARNQDGTIHSINYGDVGQNLKYYAHIQVMDRLRREYAGTNITVGGFIGMADDFPESEPLIPTAANIDYLPGGKKDWWTLGDLNRNPDFNLRLTTSAVNYLANGTALPSTIQIPNGAMPAPFKKPWIPRANTVLSGDAKSGTVGVLVVATQSLGCYRDDPKDSEFWAGSTTIANMSLRACSIFCANKHVTPYAGISGTNCRCGYVYGSLGVSQDCNVKCAGNPNEICGGNSANTVTIAQKVSSVLKYNYIGCYNDHSPDRDLDGAKFSSSTVQECAGLCNGYKYFSVQYGVECFCGNTYGRYGLSGGCYSMCPGNNTQLCGGAYANSVYSSSLISIEAVTPPDPPFQYLGCYNDNNPGRDLSGPKYDVSTVQQCQKLCSGYKYYGIQYGTECYCGNTYGRYGASGGCNSQCPGNPKQLCGGAWANSVYLQLQL